MGVSKAVARSAPSWTSPHSDTEREWIWRRINFTDDGYRESESSESESVCPTQTRRESGSGGGFVLLMMYIEKLKVQKVKVFAQLRHGERVDLEMIDLR